jgi:hypothetical protein
MSLILPQFTTPNSINNTKNKNIRHCHTAFLLYERGLPHIGMSLGLTLLSGNKVSADSILPTDVYSIFPNPKHELCVIRRAAFRVVHQHTDKERV